MSIDHIVSSGAKKPSKRELSSSPEQSADLPVVELMVRKTCGSCGRVAAQIAPVVAAAGTQVQVKDVDEDPELQMEYGDRVPVVVINGEEFACWEVDNDELAAALGVQLA